MLQNNYIHLVDVCTNRSWKGIHCQYQVFGSLYMYYNSNRKNDYVL